MNEAHALQDAIQVEQASPGKLDLPDWDEASLVEVRTQINELAATVSSYPDAFGRRGEVDPTQHLMGAAFGWGGNPQRGAMYFNITPEKNDGKTAYVAFGSPPKIVRCYMPGWEIVEGNWTPPAPEPAG